MNKKEEAERIKEAYKKREKDIISPETTGDAVKKLNRYSFFNPAYLFMIQRMEWDFLDILKEYNINEVSDKKILDIGCGIGAMLRNLIKYGAKPGNLYGIDLLSDRIELAKKLNPNIDFRCEDCSNLSFEDGSFDIIMQFTVFTSILDDEMKNSIAKEMLRLLKPGGVIVWYDFHKDNPNNKDVKGVREKEIYKLFNGCDIYLKKVTLAPPITRFVAPLSFSLAYLLEKMKFLNTHYIGIIRKK
ncbi:MAG: class I SAM-dependent methyltransferase [bacterium]|nr:class I SAM-dependent methyltransferase [bacterium]